MMKAVVFNEYGSPPDVLKVKEIPLPEPGREQVRVRLLLSPVNPSDLLYVHGVYPMKPSLPATPGFEGVGVIDKSGPGLMRYLRGLRNGRRVVAINNVSGNWQQYAIIPARQAVPVPSFLTDEQAAMFFVNPASAYIMVRHVLKVPSGAWVLQTAAGSALGRMVIRLGKRFGFKTINVVRRREQMEELTKLGGDAVICTEDESIPTKVRTLTGGQGVGYAMDAVGGRTGTQAVESLGRGGKIVIYGGLAVEPMIIPSRMLLMNHKTMEGFWLSEWAQRQSVVTMLRLFRNVAALIREGVLQTEVGQTFSMDQITEAVRQADQPGRSGKILLRLSS
jgi:NADPH:quinone reductase-like Zn-dependent oxidoreductase